MKLMQLIKRNLGNIVNSRFCAGIRKPIEIQLIFGELAVVLGK